jgi:hypothetical protein
VDAAVLEKSGGGAAGVEKKGETAHVAGKIGEHGAVQERLNASPRNPSGTGEYILKRNITDTAAQLELRKIDFFSRPQSSQRNYLD